MRRNYDEIVTAGHQRKHGLEAILRDLLAAEVANKRARSIRYQMAIAKMPVVKELSGLVMKS